MKATQLLHNLGQSLWLDNITRDLLNSGTLKRYIDELSVTGLTSNPTIFDHAIKNSSAYDAAIRKNLARVNRARSCFSIWRWKISPRPPISFDPSTTGPTAWTGGCRWRFRPCWPTTRRALSPRPRNLHARARPPEFINQDSWHQGRSARYRRGDLCRSA